MARVSGWSRIYALLMLEAASALTGYTLATPVCSIFAVTYMVASMRTG